MTLVDHALHAPTMPDRRESVMTGLLQRLPKLLGIVAVIAGISAVPLLAQPPGATMKAGFAERDITPELGMEQPGGYGKAFHRSLHDPCKVRAAVFDDGTNRVALVGIDALVIQRPQVLAARKAIQEKCGIPPERVLVAASHSHSSGPTGMILPGQYDHASQFVQELAYKKSSCADAGYLEKVVKAIVEAVCEADGSRVAARCGVGKGIEDQVAFNRRFRMKNGLSYTHPGQGNPDMIEPAGPTDPEVGVIGAWNAEGKLLGCVVNFACHATTSPGGISANYIYYLEQVIRGGMQAQDCVVVFLNGACGDITQVDNQSPYRYPSGERWARLVGGRVGAEAVKVLLSMEPGALVPVDGRAKVWKIKRRLPSPERVKKCTQLAKKTPQEVGATEWTFAKEIVLLDALASKEPEVEVEVQAVQVGPAVFVTDPAEYFCQYGLDIKAGSPFPFTFPVELADGCVGYVPTEEALGEHGGGYETRLTSYSNLEPTAGRQMADAGIELARQLTPGKVPTPPPAPEFRGQGWSYGNVPPELK
jgi:neutral ceramidase